MLACTRSDSRQFNEPSFWTLAHFHPNCRNVKLCWYCCSVEDSYSSFFFLFFCYDEVLFIILYIMPALCSEVTSGPQRYAEILYNCAFCKWNARQSLTLAQSFREVIIWNHTQGFCIQFLRLVHVTVEKINEYILFLCFLQITQMQPYVSVITFFEVSAVSKMDVFPLGMFLFVVHIFCWQTQFV